MTGNPVVDLFLALAVALGVAGLFAAGCRAFHQPPVIGEIMAGILLGNAVLPAGVSDRLLPASAKPALTALADIGLAVFVFGLGLEMDAGVVRGRGRIAAAAIAVGSVSLPLVGGVLLAIPFASRYAPPGEHLPFVLFVGVAMSVTALPVLGRILADTGLGPTVAGRSSLGAAVIGDVVAWICLAVVLALAGIGGQWRTILLIAYVPVVFGVVRPLAQRVAVAHRDKHIFDQSIAVLALVGLALSCGATEWLGLHFIFGAFAFGAALPKDGIESVRHFASGRLEGIGSLLVPLYFVLAGSNVSLSGFGPATIGVAVAVVATAVITKLAGTYVASRVVGLDAADARVVAVLMNTRGLTEVVILTVALSMHIIDQRFFSIMVLMALVTTALTGPLLVLLRRFNPPAATDPGSPRSAGPSAAGTSGSRPG